MIQRQYLLSILLCLMMFTLFVEGRFHLRKRPMKLRQMDKKLTDAAWLAALEELRTAQEELLSRCSSASECRRLFEGLRSILDHHRLSSKYLDQENDSSASIFKWG